MNIQYLCSQYIKGLEKQYDSKKTWDNTESFEAFYDVYLSGYYNRAYVIVELADYYKADFGEIAGMKESVRELDATNEAEKRNAQVSKEMVKTTQQLLNDIGFFCGSADGVAGKRTVKSIKRFQEMYGFSPVDGMIDDELVNQLSEVLNQKKE